MPLSASRLRLPLPALVLVLCACASSPVQPSGFLDNYSQLRPAPDDQLLLYYEKPGVPWQHYTKLLIDPIKVYYSPEARHREIDPEELKRLTDYAHVALRGAIGDAYPVVREPGPGVLRLRAAITNLIPANPLINVATTAAVFIPLDMGGAAIEAEFLDSQTNERLAALVDRKIGFPLAPGDIVQGFTKWGHAKRAFDAWARMLRESLDEVHGKTK